jgi:glycosyltransferase involved in cell wall biosynthesis
MSLIHLIYRKSNTSFHSIENVFNALLPYLKVKKVELPYTSAGFLKRWRNIGFVKNLNSNLIHITGHDHYLILGLPRKKTILTIHDIEVLKRNTGLKRYLLKKLWFDWPIKRATYVNTISSFSKNELLSLNNYKTPIQVIHNPITLPITYTPKTFNEECPTILHIGTKSNKNLNRLLIAIKDIKCNLVLIGKLDNIIIKILEENSINYISKVNLSNEQMIQEYISCDLLAFVSTYEGFGLPIIEAQACGRVVITSNIASMPEIAKDGALLVNPLDVNDIKDGINQLINNSNLREELISKGLKNVKRFQPETIANQYQQMYDLVLQQS